MRSEHEIAELGNYVVLLFQQDHFNSLWNEFQQDSIVRMLSTDPHEVKTREGIYAQLNGARAFLEHMRGYVTMRDEINQSIADEHHPDDGRDYD